MKAKKLMTKEEDGVLKETGNISAEINSKSSSMSSLPKWGSMDRDISISNKSKNSESRSSYNNELQAEPVVYGNRSFLSRFLETRYSDNKLSSEMTSDLQENSDVSIRIETTVLSQRSISENNVLCIEHKTVEVQSTVSELSLPDQENSEGSEAIYDKLSYSVIDEKENDTSVNSHQTQHKQSVAKGVNDNNARKVLVKVPPIRRVEEIRRRIEGSVESSKSNITRNGGPKLKGHKVDHSKSKPSLETKEDVTKTEARRTNSNSRDSPPRKASFKVRSGISNARSSSSGSISRRTAVSKGLLMENRTSNLPSSKVAALASKFNAIIHDSKDSKETDVIQKETKRSQQITCTATSTPKKMPLSEKTSVGRRNSNNIKKDSTLSNSGNSTKTASSTAPVRKHIPLSRQPILETEESKNKVNSVSSTRDYKRKSPLTYRPSSLGTKSGNVKAAIQIFEKNSSSNEPSTKVSAEPGKENARTSKSTTDPRKENSKAPQPNKEITKENAVSSKPQVSRQLQHVSEAKKEPNYPRVFFKRESTLVRVTLDIEDVCNGDIVNKTEENTSDNDLKPNDNEVKHLSENNCSIEESNAKNKNVSITEDNKHNEETVVSVEVFKEEEKKQLKTKPAVPAKKMYKDGVNKGIDSFKNNTDDSNYVKVMCATDSVCSAKKSCLSENDKNSASLQETQAISNKIYETSNSVQQKESPSMTPNKSFLWGISPNSSKPRSSDEEPSTFTAVPAIVTRDDEVNPDESSNATEVCDDDTYDDVYPPSTIYSTLQGYSVIQQQDDDVYDDVGPPVYEEKSYLKAPKISINADGDGNDSGYDYCGGSMDPSLDQTYDDCIGEDAYQRIRENNEDAESNIYDDVKPVDDMTSISNCYESIYAAGGRLGSRNGGLVVDPSTTRPGVSSSASSSIGSGNQSFCDQSNSLYGIGTSKFDSASVSQASTVSADDGAHEVLSYQLTGMGQPRSETSDEWVDVEMTDSEGEDKDGAITGYHGRSRSRRSPRRSRKARKPWSKSARKTAGNVVGVFVTSSSILYLGDPEPPVHTPPRQMCNGTAGLVSLRAILYIGESHESQEMTFFLDKEGGDISSDSDANNHHYEMLYEVVDNRNEVPYDDFDSFESDVSDETYIKPLSQANYDIANGQLPEPPPGQNIYGISKIAEAGKKMLKLGKSLRKIRNKRNSIVDEKACPPLPERPPPPPSPPPSLPSPPVPPPRMSEKSVSSGNLSGRKYWSLRKFKRSASTSDQTSASSSNGPKKETATFYLTQALDADTGNSEIKTAQSEISLENGDTPTSLGKTVTYDSGVEANSSSEKQRHSLGSTNLKKLRPSSAPERRSTGHIRPNSPPPLPPQSANSSDNPKKPARKEKRSSGSTSWYAECGLFDQSLEAQSTNVTETPKRSVPRSEKPPSNSWYAEVGLWDMGTSSANDSSLSEQDARSQHTEHSGGDSSHYGTSPENSGAVERLFADEPLYQFYAASVVERDIRGELDSDGYEEIGDGIRKQHTRPTAMELIKPREGQHRTLWCEIPEVVNSHILSTISPHQKKLQEAKFELITSEASYINSLNVLEKHFISSQLLSDETILSKNDRRILFSNVIPVKTCSERFLADLEECWQDNILLHGICEVIYKHANSHFNVYIKYCSNQIYLDRTLRGLKEQHGKFSEVLAQLESSPVCQALSLHSFLMLPMQRITRLPLLIDAVLTRLNPQDDEYDTCRMVLATLNKIVQECNEGARRMERMEEILILNRQLGFPREMKAVPIISSSRWLVKAGELTQLIWRGDEGKLTFGKKFSKVPLHLFLFTDLLFVTKKNKSEDCYVVVDYCPRNLVQMTSTEGMSHLPIKYTADGGRNIMLLTMLQNHENKTIEMILSCPLESDRQRWLEAVSPPVSDNPNETVYEEWDCPQVRAVHSYVSGQPDELSLDIGDVVNVLRKITDGWYQGERIRDGERGWFPGNHTVEIVSAHVRARNLKQRYRLLALSGNFLESQRKEKQAK